MLKNNFSKSARWYDVVQCRIKNEGACRYIWEGFSKKKSMNQYRISSICQRTTNIINCAQQGVSLVTEKGQ